MNRSAAVCRVARRESLRRKDAECENFQFSILNSQLQISPESSHLAAVVCATKRIWEIENRELKIENLKIVRM
jgi:hypothetical protein